MKTILIIIITIISFINFFPVLAITKAPTPSPTLTLTPTPTKPEDDKIQDIRQAIREKVTQIKDKMDKRAFVGIIKDIVGDTIIITNFRGQQRLNTDETTAFIGANKKDILLKDLAIDDKLIAFGILTDTNDLQAIRVTVVAPSKTTPPPTRIVSVGKVVQADLTKSTLSFANEGINASTLIYKVDKNSKYSSSLDGSLSTINIKKMTIDKRAILIYQEINKILTVKSLFYLE